MTRTIQKTIFRCRPSTRRILPKTITLRLEGAEEQVLHGALETIRRHRPVVVFENSNSAAEYGTRPDDVFEMLCGDALDFLARP